MRRGREIGIPTPYNEYTYHIIKALEEKNDGLFDYSGRDNEMIWSR
ncbi:2-dehydropantoate 2-reductase [Butyrivibrio sp. CAG:318]|nr:2-dehydropantoate 2-reductase [Butyrivibrio sp. CAG:318]